MMIIEKNELSQERVQELVDGVVDLYLELGMMPSTMRLKESLRITEEERQWLRRAGYLDERRIWRMARQKSGLELMPAAMRRNQHSHSWAMTDREVPMMEILQKMRIERPEKEYGPPAVNGKMKVTTEAIMADLLIVTQKLGRIPTQKEVRDVRLTGARYSWEMYKRIGPWKEWPEILGRRIAELREMAR